MAEFAGVPSSSQKIFFTYGPTLHAWHLYGSLVGLDQKVLLVH